MPPRMAQLVAHSAVIVKNMSTDRSPVRIRLLGHIFAFLFYFLFIYLASLLFSVLFLSQLSGVSRQAFSMVPLLLKKVGNFQPPALASEVVELETAHHTTPFLSITADSISLPESSYFLNTMFLSQAST